MLDAAHDPFVSREDSPIAATRRRLFDLLARLEKLRPAAPMCVDVLAGEAVLGTLEVADACLRLRGTSSAPPSSRDELARALHSWVSESPLQLGLVPSTLPPSPEASRGVNVTELFACAGALSETARTADTASLMFTEHAATGRMCVLLRLRERSELLPYPVGGHALDGVGLRALVKLCHAAASLVRPPGWQSNLVPSLAWGVLRIGQRAFAVIPGDTHIALLDTPEDQLDELFRRIVAEPEELREGASDAP
jgi:hypothetical protein